MGNTKGLVLFSGDDILARTWTSESLKRPSFFCEMAFLSILSLSQEEAENITQRMF